MSRSSALYVSSSWTVVYWHLVGSSKVIQPPPQLRFVLKLCFRVVMVVVIEEHLKVALASKLNSVFMNP